MLFLFKNVVPDKSNHAPADGHTLKSIQTAQMEFNLFKGGVKYWVGSIM